MFDQEIDNFQTPEVGLEVVFSLGLEQLVEKGSGGSALSDGLQEFRSHLGDAVIPQQAFAQCRRHAPVARDLLVALRVERLEDFIDKIGIVRRINRHRIADLVGQPGAFERDLEMAGVLFRIGTVQPAVDEQATRKGILAGISNGRRRLVRHDSLVSAFSHGIF